METPIVPVESIELKPGFRVKHTLLIDLSQPQYSEFVAVASTALINYMNENGGIYGNLDEGEYTVRFTPLKVEVLVK